METSDTLETMEVTILSFVEKCLLSSRSSRGIDCIILGSNLCPLHYFEQRRRNTACNGNDIHNNDYAVSHGRDLLSLIAHCGMNLTSP